MTGTLHVRRSGHAAITDLGRDTATRFGIPSNGAADQRSARVANVLVGNPAGYPLIESALGDFEFVTTSTQLIAVTGAAVGLAVDGLDHDIWAPTTVSPGATVRVRAGITGMHAYVAVHGHIEAPTLCGSVSPDKALGFGFPLQGGSSITVASEFDSFVHPYTRVPYFSFGQRHRCRYTNRWQLRVVDGPDMPQFNNVDLLFTKPFTVSPQSNYVGARLRGSAPVRSNNVEILSRGVPFGAIEAPPGDDLIVMQRGRPVTAGYPVPAVVARCDRHLLGQLRPGDTVDFTRVTIAEAQEQYLEQERNLQSLEAQAQTAFQASGLISRPS